MADSLLSGLELLAGAADPPVDVAAQAPTKGALVCELCGKSPHKDRNGISMQVCEETLSPFPIRCLNQSFRDIRQSSAHRKS